MVIKKKKAVSTDATAHSSITTDTSHATDTTAATIAAAPVVPAVLTWIQQCTTLLTQIENVVPPGGALTATDKKRRAKARKGAEQYIPQLVALANQFGVSLKLVPTDLIQKNSAEAVDLVPLLKQVGRVTKQLNDRVFQSRGDAWSDSSKLYAVLRRLSKDNGDLADGLSPVEEFFNHRHPLVAKNHPKTKAGKAKLKAQEALEQAAVATPVSDSVTPETPAVTPVATVVTAPVIAPVTPVVASPVVAVNGADGANGAAHS